MNCSLKRAFRLSSAAGTQSSTTPTGHRSAHRASSGLALPIPFPTPSRPYRQADLITPATSTLLSSSSTGVAVVLRQDTPPSPCRATARISPTPASISTAPPRGSSPHGHGHARRPHHPRERTQLNEPARPDMQQAQREAVQPAASPFQRPPPASLPSPSPAAARHHTLRRSLPRGWTRLSTSTPPTGTTQTNTTTILTTTAPQQQRAPHSHPPPAAPSPTPTTTTVEPVSPASPACAPAAAQPASYPREARPPHGVPNSSNHGTSEADVRIRSHPQEGQARCHPSRGRRHRQAPRLCHIRRYRRRRGAGQWRRRGMWRGRGRGWG